MLDWAFTHPFLTTIIFIELIICVQNIFLRLTRIIRGYPKEKSKTLSDENGGKNVEINTERTAIYHPVCDPKSLHGKTSQHADQPKT